MPSELDARGILFAEYVELKVASLTATVVEVRFLLIRVATDEGMSVVDGATADFDEASLRIFGGILPMAVTADDESVWDLGEKLTELVAFVSKVRIGMVVCFAFLVGTNDG